MSKHIQKNVSDQNIISIDENSYKIDKENL